MGGTPNYLFDWSQGTQETTSGSSTISNLAANTYTLVVTDDNGCIDTASIVLTQPNFPLDLLQLVTAMKHAGTKTERLRYLFKVEHLAIPTIGPMITTNFNQYSPL